MRKNITTIFATVLAISSVSLLVGCTGGIPDDPDAQGQTEDDNEPLTPEEKKLDEEQKLTAEEQKKLAADISVDDKKDK